jgi:hypothetical protein
VGGSAHRRELNLAKRTNHNARIVIARILSEEPGRERLYQLLSELTHQLWLNLEALVAMEEIVRGGGEAEQRIEDGTNKANSEDTAAQIKE